MSGANAESAAGSSGTCQMGHQGRLVEMQSLLQEATGHVRRHCRVCRRRQRNRSGAADAGSDQPDGTGSPGCSCYPWMASPRAAAAASIIPSDIVGCGWMLVARS